MKMSIMMKTAFYLFSLYISLLNFYYSIIKSCRINQEMSLDCLASVPRSGYWKAILCECYCATTGSKLSEERPMANLVKGRLKNNHVLEYRGSILLQRDYETSLSCTYSLISQSKSLSLFRGEDGPLCQPNLWVSRFCESVVQSLCMCRVISCCYSLASTKMLCKW